MSLIEPLLTEMEQEATTTRRLLSRVPNDKLSWKPHPKAKSLGELATHIATVPRGLSEMLQQDSLEVGGLPKHEIGDTDALLKLFDESTAIAKTNLAKLTDDQLKAPWSLTREGKPIFTLPRLAVIRTIVMNHIYHHRGQLSTYLRTLDVPVPSVYGPTADENPFM